MKRRAFTLIELIVVIAIIAILAAIVAPNAFRAVEKAKISATISDYRTIKTAAMAYYADVGDWPADCTAQPCTALTASTGPTGYDGPYMEKWPHPAKWGGVYLWRRGQDESATVGGFAWDDAPGAPQPNVRVVSVSAIPASATDSVTALTPTAAGKIDAALDGTVNRTAGNVRYAPGATTTVYIFVSRD